MFHSYRKFNQSSKKGLYIMLLAFIILITMAIIAYKGISITPKLIVKEINIINK